MTQTALKNKKAISFKTSVSARSNIREFSEKEYYSLEDIKKNKAFKIDLSDKEIESLKKEIKREVGLL